MSSIFESDNKIMVIAVSVAAVIVVLLLAFTCYKFTRRVKHRKMLEQRRRIAPRPTERDREHQPQSSAVTLGDVEYGIDTRPEAQATSYHGGMADVSYLETRNTRDEEQIPSYAPKGSAQPPGTQHIEITSIPQAATFVSSRSPHARSTQDSISAIPPVHLRDSLRSLPSLTPPEPPAEDHPPPQYDPTWVRKPT